LDLFGQSVVEPPELWQGLGFHPDTIPLSSVKTMGMARFILGQRFVGQFL
jgi:hypothetical protein